MRRTGWSAAPNHPKPENTLEESGGKRLRCSALRLLPPKPVTKSSAVRGSCGSTRYHCNTEASCKGPRTLPCAPPMRSAKSTWLPAPRRSAIRESGGYQALNRKDPLAVLRGLNELRRDRRRRADTAGSPRDPPEGPSPRYFGKGWGRRRRFSAPILERRRTGRGRRCYASH
jgi:hypothetical protein